MTTIGVCLFPVDEDFAHEVLLLPFDLHFEIIQARSQRACNVSANKVTRRVRLYILC